VKPQHDEAESVRHLTELGYVDLVEVAAREDKLRLGRQEQLRRAMELHREGRHREAVDLLGELAAEDPCWIPPRRTLAEIHYRASELGEAQTHLDWLTLNGVETPRLSLMSAEIGLARRKLHESLENLEYAAFVEPELSGVFTLLGMVLLRLNRLKSAESAFTNALERNPADARAYDGLSAISLRRGHYEAAVDFALNALDHDLRLFRAHYHLGIALSRIDRPNEAIAALETATRLEPMMAAPYRWLSRIASFQLDDSNRAIAYRELGREAIRRRRALNRQPSLT